MNKNKHIIDIYNYYQLLISYKKYFFYSISFFLSIGIIYLFLAPKYYKSEISIYHHKSNNTGMNGLNFGAISNMMNMFSGNSSSSNSSIPFSIPDIVESRTLKEEILSIDWNINEEKKQLVDFWNIEGFNELEKNEIAFQKLSKLINVKLNDTGLYIISVNSQNSNLSTLIANYISEYIIDYINTKTLLLNSNHKDFIKEQVNAAKYELSESEEILTEFHKKHLMVDNPVLLLKESRLKRNVLVNQQVYITLRQQYEIAAIEESKRDPIITVIDSAIDSYKYHSPNNILVILSSLIIALSISFLSMYLSILRKEIKNKIS